LFRASGTEPLLRIYAEAASPELVEELLGTGEAFVQSA
jgi:phosphomannomutase